MTEQTGWTPGPGASTDQPPAEAPFEPQPAPEPETEQESGETETPSWEGFGTNAHTNMPGLAPAAAPEED